MKSLCFAKRARNQLLFVWSSCHCGCQREGSDIKRDGWASCFVICHFGSNLKEATFRTWQLYFSHNPDTIRKKPRLQHSPSHSVIISNHKAQFVTLYSSPCTITYQIVWFALENKALYVDTKSQQLRSYLLFIRRPFDSFLNDLFVVTVVFYFSSVKSLLLPGLGGTPYNGLYGLYGEVPWLPPERSIFLGFRYMNG